MSIGSARNGKKSLPKWSSKVDSELALSWTKVPLGLYLESTAYICILYLYYAVVVQVLVPIIPFKNAEIFSFITARWPQYHPNIDILICLSLKDDSALWFCSQSGINTSLGGGSVIFVYSHITWPSKTLVWILTKQFLSFWGAITTQMCNLTVPDERAKAGRSSFWAPDFNAPMRRTNVVIRQVGLIVEP